VFICPGCKTRFRLTKEPASGRVKCPKCGMVSAIRKSETTTEHPAPEAPPPQFIMGAEIAGHRIIEYVGGDAQVGRYRAAQTSMGRTVLLTVLQPALAADADAKEKFFSEARSIARLNHPNLLSVFDMGEEGGACFFTTESVEGGTLPQFIARADNISSKERLAIANQVAQALAYAQSSGVQELWVGPNDVLLTDKLDVRMSHVGTSPPLRGGAPEPTINVLVRLLYIVAVGKDLPEHLRKPGAGASIGVPTVHDPLGGKLNAIVETLLRDATAYGGVSEVAAELQGVADSAHRRSTVSAATAPGGVVPLRLEKARRRRLSPLKIGLAVTGIAGIVAVIALALLIHISNLRDEEEARKLWDQSREQLAKRETRRDALNTFRQLVKRYGRTESGKEAREKGIPRAKQAIVLDEYGAAEKKFAQRPEEVENTVAQVRAAQERLREEFPGYAFVDKQADLSVKNARVRYINAARKEWQKSVVGRVESHVQYDHFGKALAEARAFIEKWPDATRAVGAAKKVIAQVETQAEKEWQETETRAQRLAKSNRTAARNAYEYVVRNFGIPEYVERARKAIEELENQN